MQRNNNGGNGGKVKVDQTQHHMEKRERRSFPTSLLYLRRTPRAWRVRRGGWSGHPCGRGSLPKEYLAPRTCVGRQRWRRFHYLPANGWGCSNVLQRIPCHIHRVIAPKQVPRVHGERPLYPFDFHTCTNQQRSQAKRMVSLSSIENDARVQGDGRSTAGAAKDCKQDDHVPGIFSGVGFSSGASRF
jgi:hypothetical protein